MEKEQRAAARNRRRKKRLRKRLIILILILALVLVALVSALLHQKSENQGEEILIDENSPLVVIDAGHGGKDPGAEAGGYQEKMINLLVAKYVQEECESLGIRTILTREDDTFLELIDRAYIANQNEAVLFVSIHCNSNPSEEINGLECYYYPEAESSYEIALYMENYLREHTLVQVNESIGGNFSVLRNTSMPAVLIELGYMTNEEDLKNLTNNVFQREMGRYISEGINEILEVKEWK